MRLSHSIGLTVAIGLGATCGIWLIARPTATRQTTITLQQTSISPQLTRGSNRSSQPAQKAEGTIPAQSKDMSGLDLEIGTDAALLIEDPHGRLTGKGGANNLVVQDIPQSAYFEDRVDNAVTGEVGTQVSRSLQIARPPEGVYRLIVTGLRQGSYDLKVSAFSVDGNAEPPIEQTGDIAIGSQITFQLNYASASQAITTLTKLHP